MHFDGQVIKGPASLRLLKAPHFLRSQEELPACEEGLPVSVENLRQQIEDKVKLLQLPSAATQQVNYSKIII